MPTPQKDETKKEFMKRCMGYPDLQDKKTDQRYAICQSLWKNKKKDETKQ